MVPEAIVRSVEEDTQQCPVAGIDSALRQRPCLWVNAHGDSGCGDREPTETEITH